MTMTRLDVLKRTSPVRVATFGDSTADVCSLSVWNVETLTAPFPASGTTSISLSSGKWLLPDYYPKTKLVANGGIGGSSTAAMLARDTAASSTTRKAISDIISTSPDVILARCGSINDLMGVTAGTVAATVAATYANHCLILDRLACSGALIVDEGLAGYSAGAATDPAATRSAVVQLNAMFKAYAAASGGRIEFLDYTSLGVTQADGNYAANMSDDGIHLSTAGQRLVARGEAKLFRAYFGYPVLSRFSGTNLVSNPLMAATGTSGIGVVATGYSINVANGTRQNAKVERLYGQVWQTVEIAPTGADASGTIVMPYDPANMGITSGDVYGFEFDWLVEGVATGVTPVSAGSGMNGRLITKKTGEGTIVVDALVPPGLVASLPNGQLMGRCVLGPFQFQAASASLDPVASQGLLFRFATGEMGTFKMGVSSPRIVKLGQPVVTG